MQLFETGRVVATPGALESPAPLTKLLARHVNGDWGDVDEEDKRTNDKALSKGGRLLSSYESNGVKVWIITEADRSTTTILLPEEY